MPISTFLGLQTALRGILAQQRALDTTSHNIANANTVGYTRQEAQLSASSAYTFPAVSRPPQGGQIGTGVDVTGFRRIRDGLIDVQLRAQLMRQGQFGALKDGLQQVELSLNEPSDSGVNSLLSRYWSAWHDVVNNAETLATRQALVESASNLAEGLRNLRSQLDSAVSQVAGEIAPTLSEVNGIGSEIANLTGQIIASTAVGDQPNDLLDRRDHLLDRLSTFGNVTVTAGANGSIDVTIGGAVLTTGDAASTIVEADLTNLTSGKLMGLTTLRDTTVTAYIASLDTVASTLIAQTNAAHAAGFDLAGAAGGAFFSGTNASDIAVNGALLANASLIAASANGQPGNGANAQAIADLRTTALIGGATIDAAYAQLVVTIGSDSAAARRDFDNATTLVDSMTDRRDSVSGVSLDEEMANLVRFQRGFQASSRAMSAMDEMIELLITRTGRVGL